MIMTFPPLDMVEIFELLHRSVVLKQQDRRIERKIEPGVSKKISKETRLIKIMEQLN
jgi:hypothetical protein